jgi:hypothetical protein
MTTEIQFASLNQGYNNPEIGIELSPFQYAQLAEDAVATRLVEMLTSLGIQCSITEHTEGYDPRYDFRINNTKVELKISRMMPRGKQTLPIETHSKSPSGIVASGLSISEADAYLFITPGMWIGTPAIKWRILPTTQLRKYVNFTDMQALTGVDSKGYQALGDKLRIDQHAPISLDAPFGDGMFAFGKCDLDDGKPWSFDVDSVNLFRKNKVLLSAIGDMFK